MLEILKKVQQKVQNNNHQGVILGVYQNLIKRHNDFCDCNYCQLLRIYVEKKKHKAKVNRNYLMEYDYYSLPVEYFDIHDKLKNEIKQLKIAKDKLKKLL